MEVWNHPFPWRLIYCSFEKYSSDFLKPTSKSNWQQEHQIYGFQLHVQAAGRKTPTRRAYQFIKEDEKGNRCQLNDQLRYSINCQMQDIEAFIPSCFQFPLSMPSASAQEFRGSWCWDRHAKAKFVSTISRSRFGFIWNLRGIQYVTREQFSRIVPEYDSWIESVNAVSVQDRMAVH